MHARVTQFHIAPEQFAPFLAAMEAALPHARQQKGFRGLLALRGGTSAPSIEVRVMSIWNSLEDLQAGEQNFYFYQALAKVMAASKAFPLIESQEVLFAEFGGAAHESRGGDGSMDETLF
jgi:heme-degrading monooxygenase HmoA